jgi:hypothetical protein
MHNHYLGTCLDSSHATINSSHVKSEAGFGYVWLKLAVDHHLLGTSFLLVPSY